MPVRALGEILPGLGRSHRPLHSVPGGLRPSRKVGVLGKDVDVSTSVPPPGWRGRGPEKCPQPAAGASKARLRSVCAVWCLPWLLRGGWAGVWPCPQPLVPVLGLISGPSQHPSITGPRSSLCSVSPTPASLALSSLSVAYLKDRRLSGGAGSPAAPPLMHGPCPQARLAPSSVLCQSDHTSLWFGTFSCPAYFQSPNSPAHLQLLGRVGALSLFRAVDWLGFRAVLLLGCPGLCGFQSSGRWNQTLSEVEPSSALGEGAPCCA